MLNSSGVPAAKDQTVPIASPRAISNVIIPITILMFPHFISTSCGCDSFKPAFVILMNTGLSLSSFRLWAP